MNILILADGDWSGAGYALYQAINEHTEHKARQVAFDGNYLAYACDLFAPKPTELRELIEWCDVLNLHDSNDWLVPQGAPSRPVVTTYHGSQYRARWMWYNSYDRDGSRISTALNLDLAMYGPRWVGRPMPDLSYMKNHHSGNGKLRVCHAPSNRAIKNTAEVVSAMEGLPGVEFVLIEGLPNDECLRIKATCDVLLEEFILGYGTNALESWSMGTAVVANAHPQLLMYMRDKLGELPFIPTPVNEIRSTVERLRDDTGFRRQATIKGREYWLKHHHPQRVADKFVEVCKECLK